MLANVIQTDAASGKSNQSPLPLQSSGQGASNFASTLQSAVRSDPAVPVRSQAVATTVAGPGKSAEKNSAENSRTPAGGQLTPGIRSTPVAGAKASAPPAADAKTMPALVPNLAASLLPQGSILPSVMNWRSDFASRGDAGAGSAKQSASVGSAGQVRKDGSTATLATVFDSGLSVTALEAGSQTPASAPASLPNSAAPAMQVTPVPACDASPPLTSLDESHAGKSVAASNGVTEPVVAAQELPNTPPSAPSGSDAPAQSLTPPTAELAGAAGNGNPQPIPATPIQSGMPLRAMDPANGAVNAAAGVQPSAAGAKPPSGSGEVVSPSPNPPIAGKPLPPTDPAAGTPQHGAAVDQAAFDNKLQSRNGSGQDNPATPAASLTDAGAVLLAEALKPGWLHPAMTMKAGEPVPAADVLAKETSTAQASSKQTSLNQASSNQVPANQVPSNQVPSNQEGTRPKPTDSAATPVDTNVQAPSPNVPAASVTSQANGGDQPVSAAATASVLTQVPPAANQDSGGRSTPLPAAEPQSPAAAAPTPTPLPAVGPVETARLVAGVAQSEMHIGLRTQAFGSVDVRTVVRDSQVGLTVGSERGDLRTLLAPEVAGLQTTFRQQDLHFDSIHYLETNSGTTSGFSGGADSQARSPGQQHASPAGVFSIHSPPEDSAEADSSAGLRTRLNVHA